MVMRPVPSDHRSTVEGIRKPAWLDVDNAAPSIRLLLPGARYRVDQVSRTNDQAWIGTDRSSVGLSAMDINLATLHEAAGLYVNFFLPSFKLRREGAKVTRRTNHAV